MKRKLPLLFLLFIATSCGSKKQDDPVVIVTPVNTNAYTVSTFAGSGKAGYAEGTGIAAQFNGPTDVALDPFGNIYVTDGLNQRIRMITPAAITSTLAGTGMSGNVNGPGASAQFSQPNYLATDAAGNIYETDFFSNWVRKITPMGLVATLAGKTSPGYANGTGTAANFNAPTDLVADANGNVYVADYNNHRIRKIDPNGVVTTFAGSNTTGAADGTGEAAQFRYPNGITIDAAGNLYVADSQSNNIRRITPGAVVTTITGSAAGYADGPVAKARFNQPQGLAIDAAGNLYVADVLNYCIRKISTDGVVSTVAGNGSGNSAPGFKDGAGDVALFNRPLGLTIDAAGTIYVADQNNNRIRKIVHN